VWGGVPPVCGPADVPMPMFEGRWLAQPSWDAAASCPLVAGVATALCGCWPRAGHDARAERRRPRRCRCGAEPPR